MTEGLRAVYIPFGYSVTILVGYLERVQGDEWVMRGRRILTLGNKTHEQTILDGTSELAPKMNHGLHRLQILNWCEAPKVWKELVG